MNQYKDFASQNLIELRFANKNARELSQDEAMIKYKRNNYILGRIFSYDVDENCAEASLETLPMKDITQEQVQMMEEELEQVKQRHKSSVEDFRTKQLEFKKNIEEASHFKDNESLENYIQQLLENEQITVDYPFFKKNSPFYLCLDKAQVKEVALPAHKAAYRERQDDETFAVFHQSPAPPSQPQNLN